VTDVSELFGDVAFAAKSDRTANIPKLSERA